MEIFEYVLLEFAWKLHFLVLGSFVSLFIHEGWCSLLSLL